MRSQRPSSNQTNIDQMQIVLSFLKKRFSDYSLDDVMLSLVQHVNNQQFDNEEENRRDFDQQWRENQENRRGRNQGRKRNRITHHVRDQRELRENISSIAQDNDEKMNQLEEMRMVAMFFCQTGINFKLVQNFFPQMTPQKYRSYLDRINGQAINDIQKYLRYQCNIQIEHLSTEQKRSLRDKLIKVRQWLSLSRLQTYYAFISKHYEQKPVQLRYDDAIRLYKTFLQVIKSPYVDVMEVVNQQHDLQLRPPQNETNPNYRTTPPEIYTRDERHKVIEVYLKQNNLQKTCKKLNQTYGYNIKWNQQSLTNLLRYTLKKSIKKTIASKTKYLPRSLPIYFSHSDPQIKKIIEDQNAQYLRNKLLRFYLANKISVHGLNNIINKMNLYLGKDVRNRQRNDGRIDNNEGNQSRREEMSDQEAFEEITKQQFDQAKKEDQERRHQRQVPMQDSHTPSQEQIKTQEVQQAVQNQQPQFPAIFHKDQQLTQASLADMIKQQDCCTVTPVNNPRRNKIYRQVIEIN